MAFTVLAVLNATKSGLLGANCVSSETGAVPSPVSPKIEGSNSLILRRALLSPLNCLFRPAARLRFGILLLIESYPLL